MCAEGCLGAVATVIKVWNWLFDIACPQIETSAIRLAQPIASDPSLRGDDTINSTGSPH